MTTSTPPEGSGRNRSGYYDKPGLRLRLLQMLLHTDDAHQEALLGDLLEERAGGRSRFWFWGQVVYAAFLAHTDQFHKPGDFFTWKLASEAIYGHQEMRDLWGVLVLGAS